MFSTIRDAHLDPWTRPLHVPAPDGGEYVLTQRPAANRLWKPQEFDLIPADELNVRGKFVVPRVTRQGIGASLVAVRTRQAPRIRQRFVPPRIYLSVTAVAHLSGRKYEIEFIDPLSAETASLSGRSLPSGADFTAPLALGLSRERPEKIGVPAMLDPERFVSTARLIQVQPYDPQKMSEAGTYGCTVGFDRHFEIFLSGHFLIDSCSSFLRKGFVDLISSHGAMPGGRHRRAGWRASKMGSLSETGGKR